MSRKVGKSLAGQRRRSPRISALHSCKESPQKKGANLDDAVAVAALPPLSKLSKQVWKGRDSPKNADCVEWRSLKENQNHDHHHHQNNLYTNGTGNGNGNGNASVMPAKHILELLLDTLQRRDTYEIFGQPVDPEEVEDYYEIIKEPMDFGTMRAKLHEGMYQNLQQFEHDVFLIPENAMHFNSSSTTYFRQARAIHELANKVFHVLKTNPQNFVSEFSGTRRRSMRKALSESKDPPQSPSTSTFRTYNRKSPAFHFGRVSDSQVADRRETYLSGKDEDPVYSTFSKQSLVLMNQGDISYEDSLMWFVKELGPTAKMIAKRKLLGQQHESNKKCQQLVAKEFKTFRDFAPAACNPFVKASNIVDSTLVEEEEEDEDSKLKHRKRKEKTADKNSMVRDLNCSSRPVILALESYHSEHKTRNKKSFNVPAPPTKLITEKSAQQQQHKPSPLMSHFTFDLHFLKARLDQMKAVEKGLKRK